ncbi:MAG: winged helix-turn-helix transcriptional regulator [Actinobacteria bacterium]|nr:winged helix-turn-helix transcriptional regulator [Actinomycetota bacterium]
MTRADDPSRIAVPAAAPRPPRDGAPADRAFATNLLGTFALTVCDRLALSTREAVQHGANAPAALVTLLWYPDRPIGFLAARLRITHPGAVQLADRLGQDGLVERIPALDGRTKLLALTDRGEAVALEVLARRRDVLARAVAVLDDDAVRALARTMGRMLEAITDDLLTSEYMCRMCDELACPDARCPVEHAAPAPPHRRGLGYGVPDPD